MARLKIPPPNLLWLTAVVGLSIGCLGQQGNRALATGPGYPAVVLEVVKADLIEVSMGSDDGLKIGHAMTIYRGNQYVAQIIIRKTGSDRAVGQIDPALHLRKVQKGDRVHTDFRFPKNQRGSLN